MNILNEEKCICPICQNYYFEKFGDYDICPNCNWENDTIQWDDHNYAGGANTLSVNEERIEYFLCRFDKTKNKSLQLKESFEEENAEIYKKYAGINYVVDIEKSKEMSESFEKIRKNYIDKLNFLLQLLAE